MELGQLEYFLEAARREHITQAAEALHITQPALSRVIARLEADLGMPLFTADWCRAMQSASLPSWTS